MGSEELLWTFSFEFAFCLSFMEKGFLKDGSDRYLDIYNYLLTYI